MSDHLIDAVRAKAEKMRAVVVTQHHKLDGHLHLPKTIKEQRRLTTVLNSDRRFLAMTNVTITNLLNGQQDPDPAPFMQVNVESIEFVRPHPEELEHENARAAQQERLQTHARDVLGDAPPSF